MKAQNQRVNPWVIFAGLLSITLTAILDGKLSFQQIIYFVFTWAVLVIWGWVFTRAWRKLSHRLIWRILSGIGFLVILSIYILASFWLLHPDVFPQRISYDFIENRHVTEKLVDPALLKVERWNILDEENDVLFVHPSSTGSTALVYPVMVEAKTTFYTKLAVAPEAWKDEGDGVIFSVYIEDDAGFHLLFSQYVDPKHQQQDRRWIPVEVSLDKFTGKLVRIILVVNSGPAGDMRFDWAGWGEPRLEQPIWP